MSFMKGSFRSKKQAESIPEEPDASSFVISAQLNDSTATAATAKSEKAPGCWPRFLGELNPCQPWFLVADSTGRKIDIPESFAPASCAAFLCKFVVAGLALGTMIYGWIIGGYPDFYLAYLTHWALLLAVLYSIFSLWNTIVASRTPQPPDAAGCRIRATWILFEMAAHTEVMASILWWVLEYKPGVTTFRFLNITTHLVIAILIWFIGLYVDRTPVRLMHWWGFILPLDILYVVWTIIHWQTDIGNPFRNDNDPATNDDTIYPAIAWQDNWVKSLVICLICIFALGPAIYLLLWLCSLYHIPCFCMKDRRRYVDSYKNEHDQRPTVDDVEEGSIFARWR